MIAAAVSRKDVKTVFVAAPRIPNVFLTAVAAPVGEAKDAAAAVVGMASDGTNAFAAAAPKQIVPRMVDANGMVIGGHSLSPLTDSGPQMG